VVSFEIGIYGKRRHVCYQNSSTPQLLNSSTPPLEAETEKAFLPAYGFDIVI